MNEELPTKRDFLEHHACLDAQCAWRDFGGLSLKEAYSKFCEAPENYQEDFMFMGDRAFAYYFPVVDRYVREQLLSTDGDLSELWILAHAVAHHFPFTQRSIPASVVEGIRGLCQLVLQRLATIELDTENSYWPKEDIVSAWDRLHRLVQAD